MNPLSNVHQAHCVDRDVIAALRGSGPILSRSRHARAAAAMLPPILAPTTPAPIPACYATRDPQSPVPTCAATIQAEMLAREGDAAGAASGSACGAQYRWRCRSACVRWGEAGCCHSHRRALPRARGIAGPRIGCIHTRPALPISASVRIRSGADRKAHPLCRCWFSDASDARVERLYVSWRSRSARVPRIRVE